MDLDEYDRSFSEICDTVDEEAYNRLRSIRQLCLRNFLDHLNKRQQEWDELFQEILLKSQEEVQVVDKPLNSSLNKSSGNSNLLKPKNLNVVNSGRQLDVPSLETIQEHVEHPSTTDTQPEVKAAVKTQHEKLSIIKSNREKSPELLQKEIIAKDVEFIDPYFSNSLNVEEFHRLQELLRQYRNACSDFYSDQNLKSYKNELSIFIKTQINTISNSDPKHCEAKINHLTNLFSGCSISFQNRFVDTSKHFQAKAFSVDFAALTFVTVGSKLINSVPAIAKSMAAVIDGVDQNMIPDFKDLIIGQLQERCPYLIPIYYRPEDFPGSELQHKIVCGYLFDTKTQILEPEDKYLTRIRSMTLLYGCMLVKGHIQKAWAWLASFLSLDPEPVITATVLQAFLQETSKDLSSVYGRQYKKLLVFMKKDFLDLIEKKTVKGVDKQSLIKLKNFLSDDTNLIAQPKVSSIFAPVRFG